MFIFIKNDNLIFDLIKEKLLEKNFQNLSINSEKELKKHIKKFLNENILNELKCFSEIIEEFNIIWNKKIDLYFNCLHSVWIELKYWWINKLRTLEFQIEEYTNWTWIDSFILIFYTKNKDKQKTFNKIVESRVFNKIVKIFEKKQINFMFVLI